MKLFINGDERTFAYPALESWFTTILAGKRVNIVIPTVPAAPQLKGRRARLCPRLLLMATVITRCTTRPVFVKCCRAVRLPPKVRLPQLVHL